MRSSLRRNVRFLWSRFLHIFSGTEEPGPQFRRVFSALYGYRLAGTRGTAVPLCFSALCRGAGGANGAQHRARSTQHRTAVGPVCSACGSVLSSGAERGSAAGPGGTIAAPSHRGSTARQRLSSGASSVHCCPRCGALLPRSLRCGSPGVSAALRSAIPTAQQHDDAVGADAHGNHCDPERPGADGAPTRYHVVGGRTGGARRR